MPFLISKTMVQVYLIGTSVCFFYYNTIGPTATFFRAVPAALLTIDNAPTPDTITFSQQDNTGGLPSPFLSVLFEDIVNQVGVAYTSITTMIAAITPASSGGGGTVTAPDIATYDVQYDLSTGATVRVLTVFDPVTNAPTRTFTNLDGTAYPTADPLRIAPYDTRYALSNNILFTDIERKLGNLLFALGIADNAPATDPQPLQTFTQTVITASGTDEAGATTEGAQKVQIIALSGNFTMNRGSLIYPLPVSGGGVIPSFDLEASFGKKLPAIPFVVTDGGSVLLIQLFANI